MWFKSWHVLDQWFAEDLLMLQTTRNRAFGKQIAFSKLVWWKQLHPVAVEENNVNNSTNGAAKLDRILLQRTLKIHIQVFSMFYSYIIVEVLQSLLSTLSFLHRNPDCFINLNTRKRWNDRTFQWASDQMVLATFLPRKIRIEGDGVNSKLIKCNLPISK